MLDILNEERASAESQSAPVVLAEEEIPDTMEKVEEEKIEEAGEEEENPEISVNPVQSEKPGMVNESTPSTGDPAGNIGKYLLLCMSMLTIIAASVWRKVKVYFTKAGHDV